MTYDSLAETLIQYQQPKSSLELYLENDFLSVLNESALSKEINRQIDLIEARIKLGKFTEADAKKLEELIKEALSKNDEIPASALFGIFLTYAGLGIAYGGAAGVATGITDIAIGGAIAGAGAAIEIAGLIVAIFSSNKSDMKITKHQFESFYNKVMKKEAKAKANLIKIEALDDAGSNGEQAKKVYKEIIKACEIIRSNYKKISKTIEDVKNTDDYTGKFAESVVLSESGEVEILTEIKGNEFKNQLFIQVLDDANEYFTDIFNYVKKLDSSISKLLSAGSGLNDKNIGSYIVQFRKTGRELNNMKDNSSMANNMVIKNLKKNIGKFNNRYSEIGLTERKKLMDKLEQYAKGIEDIIKKYDPKRGSINNEVINILDKLDENFTPNDPRIKELMDIIDSWTSGLYKTSISALEKINNIRGFISGQEALDKSSLDYIIFNFKGWKEEMKELKEKRKEEKARKKEEMKDIKAAKKIYN